MTSPIRKLWLVLAAFILATGILPALGIGTSHAGAGSSYKAVTLKYGSKNIYLSGTSSTLSLGTSAAETFLLTDWGDGTVSLRSRSNGLFVSVVTDSQGRTSLAANAAAVTASETFRMTANASKTAYSILSMSNNRYLASPGSNSTALQVNATSQYALQVAVADVTPAPSSQQINILEITDSGQSDLLPILSTYVAGNGTTIHIDSVRMKQFVALRDELDGRYDAIYIGQGSYNSTMVGTDQNHNTTSIMNDITNLKMNEIKNDYIDRGLPVIVYSQRGSWGSSGSGALYQNTAGILKAGFQPYVYSNTSSGITSNKENVIFVGNNDIDSASDFLSKTDLLDYAAQRPRLLLTAKPTDYTQNPNQVYVAGDTLTYTFNLANVSNIAQRSLVANLYIGIDQVLQFNANNLVASQPVTATSGNKLTFRLPKGYSGLHYWKLELVDQGSKKKDIQTGVLRFRDELTKINVLQILPNTGDSSSLLKDSNLKQSYLKSDDYAITIKTMSIDDFDKSGYLNLNGYYDMLIFGFSDYYNKYAPITKAAAAAVNSFIATGQSVMFTHDTVFQGDATQTENGRNWITYFQAATGQVSPMTNMGLNAVQPSTTTKKVNDGLLTEFPFDISSIPTNINTTHDQYFGLKLEDPKLIPWYNITGGTRDDDDSWNHYYTYSYGNVTYSGTGHTNTSFPEWEQKLFVNTMYRAFIGSNHAPIVNVVSPTNTAQSGVIIPSYNKVLLNYTAQDYDIIDRTLSTTVKFKYRKSSTDSWTEKVVKPDTDTKTGDTLTESYDNPLPDGGDLVIEVTAKDKSGASATQTITTQVVKVTANVDLSRTLSDNVKNNQVEKNTSYTMTYTVKPKSIPYRSGIAVNDLVIRDFKLDENLPANLQVSAADVSQTLLQPSITGSLSSGYRLTGTLPDIHYRLSTDRTQFIADPITFTVSATPKENGNYLVENSNLQFTDFYVNGTTVTKDIQRSLKFQPYAIQAVTTMKTLSLPDAVIAKGDQSILVPVITPDDTTNKTLTWSSNHPDIVSVDNNGIIEGVAEGTAQITAKATDGSGLTAVSNVTVVVPGINIVGPDTVNVNDTINLEARLILANESLQSITWSVGSNQSQFAALSNGDDNLKKKLTGLKAGKVDVTVTAVTDKGKTYTKTVTITVVQPIGLSLPPVIYIGKGDEWQRNLWNTALTVTPDSSKNEIQHYTTWTSGDASVLSVEAGSGIASGKKTGSTQVQATYQKDPVADPVTASARVVVVDLNVPPSVTVVRGGSLELGALVSMLPVEASSVLQPTWSMESGKGYASVSTSGKLVGLSPGTEYIRVTYRDPASGEVVISKTILVNVIERSGHSGGNKY